MHFSQPKLFLSLHVVDEISPQSSVTFPFSFHFFHPFGFVFTTSFHFLSSLVTFLLAVGASSSRVSGSSSQRRFSLLPSLSMVCMFSWPSVCLIVSLLCVNVVLFCVCVACPPPGSLWWRRVAVSKILLSGRHLKLLHCPPGPVLFTYVL